MKLTDKKIKSLKPKNKEYKVFDGRGLHILIHPNGSRYWRLRYRFNGKDKAPLALGVYPELSLSEAREKTMEIKKQIKEGIDPSQQRKIDKLLSKVSEESDFEAVAREWHEPVWRSTHHQNIYMQKILTIFIS